MSDDLKITQSLSRARGVHPAVDAAADLPNKEAYDVNSWFFIGHFEVDGEKLNFLHHVFVSPTPDGRAVTSSLAFTNETTGTFFGGVTTDPVEKTEISADMFNIAVPMGSMAGDLGQLRIKAHIPEGSIDLVMKPTGHVLYNGGTGLFPMLRMDVHQYSVPTMDTTGTLTIRGPTYEISDGTSWFDRQWQNLNPAPDGKPLNGKWAWMDLNLDNGDRISLWSADDTSGGNNSWATVLHPDGHQTVASIEPLSVGESEYWTSTDSGKRYPTRWTVRIPAFDAELEVTPFPREQELVPNQVLAYYEAASSVRGTYRGKETTGYSYVELVGQWN
ncbi:lipocalin family protein [Streptomyces mirabilis]|uniref:lipocalin family protein n=1 Tax=Streptomyces mirabilis TaxID=68239 RepID=UPI003667E212